MIRITGAILMVSLLMPLLALPSVGVANSKKDDTQNEEQSNEVPGLPWKDKVIWNTRGLENRFKILKVSHDTKYCRITWLLEVKQEGTILWSDLDSSFFDKDCVRIGDFFGTNYSMQMVVEGGIEKPISTDHSNNKVIVGMLKQLLEIPEPTVEDAMLFVCPPLSRKTKVKKSERLRFHLNYPADITIGPRKIAYVMVASKELPENGK